MTTKNSDYLYWMAASDIHLHHPRTPTRLIIENLDRDIIRNPEARLLDIIWIPGDLLDRLLTVPDIDNHLITMFLGRLLRFCKKHDIALRILEGTGSHDYSQSAIIVTINEAMGIDADLRYYNKLSYDTEERFGISVLYVPDELNADATVTWKQTQKLLSDFGATHVDYAIMHGMFEFQLPAHVNDLSAHLSSRFESIVRKHVVIGHHHTHRIEGKIIVPGSFDRLAHNEEMAKGSIWCKDYGNRTEVKFLENVGAKIYKSIHIGGLSIDEAIARVDAVVEGKPPGSAFLVKGSSEDPASKAGDLFKSRHDKYVWSFSFEREDKTSQRIEEMEVSYTPVRIDKDNLPSLTMERLATDDQAIRKLSASLLANVL